jgi:hypothetical protein
LQIEGVYAVPYSFQYRLDGVRLAYDLLESGHEPDTADADTFSRYRGQAEGLRSAGINPHELTQPTPAQGVEQSYQEILTVYEKMGMDSAGVTFRGSPRYLTSLDEPVQSEAAEHLIERALASPDDDPLYVVAIGCVTNIASAMLIAPEIIEKIVVIWTSGYPSTAKQPNLSFNLEQDMLASKLMFDSGVPLVYLPGFQIGAQLRLSLPEMETWVRGQGAIGDYLHHLYTHNPIWPLLGIDDHFGRAWIMWDLVNIAWLLNPDWVPTDLLTAPLLADDERWYHNPARHLIREAHGIDRDAIFRDFFRKLAAFAAGNST